MAFLVAFLVLVAGAIVAFVTAYASMMSDSQSASTDTRAKVWIVLFWSMAVAAIVAASHFISWSW
jgi:heme/copper-type cytochrome/quinol oxidase subunit 2